MKLSALFLLVTTASVVSAQDVIPDPSCDPACAESATCQLVDGTPRCIALEVLATSFVLRDPAAEDPVATAVLFAEDPAVDVCAGFECSSDEFCTVRDSEPFCLQRPVFSLTSFIPEDPPPAADAANVTTLAEPIQALFTTLQDPPPLDPPTDCSVVTCPVESPCEVVDGVAQCTGAVVTTQELVLEDSPPETPLPVVTTALELDSPPEGPLPVVTTGLEVPQPLDAPGPLSVEPPTDCAAVTCPVDSPCEVIDGVAQCAGVVTTQELVFEDPAVTTAIGDSPPEGPLPVVITALEDPIPLDSESPVSLDPPTDCAAVTCPVGSPCEVVDGVAQCVETVFTTQENSLPVWWDQVKSNFEGIRLKMCNMRDEAPEEGSKCAKKPRTCFFGTQTCPGDVGPHPTERCFCGGLAGGRKWSCEPFECPASPTDPIV